MKTQKLIIIVVLLAMLLSACGEEAAPQIQVQNPWARTVGGAGMVGMNGAAYMALVNRGRAADRLVHAECNVAQAVELRETKMEGGVMKMSPVQFIEVPARGRTKLEPGGLYIMLVGLKHEIKPSEKISITLVFEKSGSITIEAEVEAM